MGRSRQRRFGCAHPLRWRNEVHGVRIVAVATPPFNRVMLVGWHLRCRHR
jgi:hypothetical protein